MTPAGDTQWSSVFPGMYIQAADGSVWRVDGKRRDVGQDGWTLRITNRAGASVDVSRGPEEAVTILEPTMEEAEALIMARLPVSAVQRRVIRMEQVTRPQILAAHLLNHHGISVATSSPEHNKDLAGLLEMHAIAHAQPESATIPHVHVSFDQL